uniref:Uncharacterized protein n=1 Tax=Ascaris lumbricoides TaxID=6252 RepID=A0A9J2P9L2_ASCLU
MRECLHRIYVKTVLKFCNKRSGRIQPDNSLTLKNKFSVEFHSRKEGSKEQFWHAIRVKYWCIFSTILTPETRCGGH